MTDYKKYKVGITAKENWASDISFEQLDYTLWSVNDGGDGCGYIALKDNIGVLPNSDVTTWRKAAEAGQSIYDLAVKYHHFVGTEEEFESQYQQAISGAISAAQSASAIDAQVRAAEQQRVVAEQERVSAENTRLTSESARVAAETERQDAENTRILNEEARVSSETERLSAETERQNAEAFRVRETASAITDANTARDQADTSATRANAAATNAESKATLANGAATLANTKAQLANDKAALAETAGANANGAATLAQQKAIYAETQGDYAKAQGDYAKAQGDTALADHERAESDHTRAKSDHADVEVYVDSLGVFDLSKHNAVGGVLATYADLSAAITALNDLESKYKYGGMSFKFIQSSDNKYVQYRLKADEFSTDVEDWEQAASVAQLEELEDNAVMTGSYDATVAVGLADNLRGDTIVDAEFYKRKTGGTQSVGSGIAAIKEVRGKSVVWNQIMRNFTSPLRINVDNSGGSNNVYRDIGLSINSTKLTTDHKLYINVDYTINTAYSEPGYALYIYNYQTMRNVNVLPKESLIKAAGRYKYRAIANEARTSYTSSEIRLYLALGAGNRIDISINAFNIIDLTEIYGAGNEPATVQAFEKMFPFGYCNYNMGTVTPFAGENLVTTGKNQYNPATGKANLLGGQTYQIGGTYTSATIDGIVVTLDSNDCFTTTKDCVLDITGGNDNDTIVALYNGDNVTFEPYERHTLPLDPSQWRDKQGNLVFPYGGMHGAGGAYDYAKVDADGYIRKAMRVYEKRAYESGDITSGNIITDGRKNTFYPLAEPVEVELATPVYAKYLVDKDGTEEITPANGTAPYTTMANLSILYAMDARGEIKNLPKNYLSKESTENMLNAMVSACVIANYTMTYDDANARYAFTIVAPTQSNE